MSLTASRSSGLQSKNRPIFDFLSISSLVLKLFTVFAVTVALYHPTSARLVTDTTTRRSEHITPVLRSLHWLPLARLSVRQRITFKVATIVRNCLNGRIPVPVQRHTVHWSASGRHALCQRGPILEVPRSRTAIGDRSFSIAGPRVWNTLPASVRDKNSSLCFRKLIENVSFCLTATAQVALNWRP